MEDLSLEHKVKLKQIVGDLKAYEEHFHAACYFMIQQEEINKAKD